MTVHPAHTRILRSDETGQLAVPFTRVALNQRRDLRPLLHRGARLGPRGRPGAAAPPAGSRAAPTPRRTTDGETQLIDNGRSAVRRGAANEEWRGERRRPLRGENVTQMAYAPRGCGHRGDALRRRPRGLRRRAGSAARVAAGRAIIPANVNHPESEPMIIGKRFLVEDQRQHRQLRGHLVDRRGGRQAHPRDHLGRGHRHGPLDRRGHPHHARVDHPQLAGPDRHRADLPGAGEGQRCGGQALGGRSSATRHRAVRAGRSTT
jgi:hypothetical protein